MEMQNDLLDCIDGRMCFGIGIDVAAIEIDAVGIHSVVPTCHSVRVEDGK